MQHPPGVDADILAFHLQGRFGRERLNDEMVVTVRTVFITMLGSVIRTINSFARRSELPVLELAGVFAETLFALFASEYHLEPL